jgi:hypothetical protein
MGFRQIIPDSVFILIMRWWRQKFPEGEFDADLQQVDSEKTNSCLKKPNRNYRMIEVVRTRLRLCIVQ